MTADETRTVIVEREIPHPPERLARADSATLNRGVADEE